MLESRLRNERAVALPFSMKLGKPERPKWSAPTHSMIVEFFGPPASGKTSLANALVPKLQRAGLSVQHVASARPSEQQSNGVADRLSKLAGGIASWKQADVGNQLLQIMPPRGVIRRYRLKQYFNWLNNQSRTLGSNVKIFDQGYLNALCSLSGGYPRSGTAALLRQCLDIIPQPDIVVRLHASPDVLRDRLKKRLNSQAKIQNIFEQSLDSSLAQASAVWMLEALIREREWNIVDVDCATFDQLEGEAERVAGAILMQLQLGKHD